MFATSLALIGQEFQGKDRATAFGVWGATIGGAVAIGPLVGGVHHRAPRLGVDLLRQRPDRDRGDRPAETQAGRVAAQDAAPIDFPGLITFSLGLFVLIFGLIRGNPEGWGSGVIVASLAARGRAAASPSSRSSARSDHPMLDLSLFRKPGLQGRLRRRLRALGAGCSRCSSTSRSTCRACSAISPLEAGLRFLPLTVLSFIASPIAARSRTGSRSGCCWRSGWRWSASGCC